MVKRHVSHEELINRALKEEPPVKEAFLRDCNTRQGCDSDQFAEYRGVSFKDMHALVRECKDEGLIFHKVGPSTRPTIWETTRKGEIWVQTLDEKQEFEGGISCRLYYLLGTLVLVLTAAMAVLHSL